MRIARNKKMLIALPAAAAALALVIGGIYVAQAAGNSAEFSQSGDVLVAYLGSEEEVTLPASATKIGSEAFAGNTTLRRVTIPETVTEIGYGAFSGCTALESVALPDSVVAVADSAFNGCTALTDVSIGAGLYTLGSGVFSDCDSLESVKVSSANTALRASGNALYNANETVLYQYFAGSPSHVFVLPGTVEEVRRYSFWGCDNLEVLTLTGMTKLGDYAVADATGLKGVVITAPVNEIGMGAFSGCTQLRQVELPASLSRIHETAFEGCPQDLVLVCAPATAAQRYGEAHGMLCSETPPYTFVLVDDAQGAVRVSGAGAATSSGDGAAADGNAADQAGAAGAADGSGSADGAGAANGNGGSGSGADGSGNGSDTADGGSGSAGAGNGNDAAGGGSGNGVSARNSGSILLGGTSVVGDRAYLIVDGMTVNGGAGAGSGTSAGGVGAGTAVDGSGTGSGNAGTGNAAGSAGTVAGGAGAGAGSDGAGTGAAAGGNSGGAGNGSGAGSESVGAAGVPDYAHYLDLTLTSYDFGGGEGMTRIGSFAFARTGLTEAAIPEGVSEIGEGAFYHCDQLSSVTIPSTVISIGRNAFNYTPWYEAWWNDAGTGDFLIVGDGVLIGYKGKDADVTIPDTVKVVADGVFGE